MPNPVETFGIDWGFLADINWDEAQRAKDEREALPDLQSEVAKYFDPNDLMYLDRGAYADIQDAYRGQGEDVLGRLMDTYTSGGLTAIDRARMADIRRNQGAWERGQREANLAQAARRGLTGSGVELLSNLIATQGAADAIARADLETEAMAQQRAMDALLNAGQQADLLTKNQTTIDQYNQDRNLAIDEANANRWNEMIAQGAAQGAGAAGMQFQGAQNWAMGQEAAKQAASQYGMNYDLGLGLQAANQYQKQLGAEFDSGALASNKATNFANTMGNIGNIYMGQQAAENERLGKTAEKIGSAIGGGGGGIGG